jgi:hypothetical protein
LWYVNRGYGESILSISAQHLLQLEHIIAPFIGAVAAGLFCNYMFPDNPTSWKRTAQRLK